MQLMQALQQPDGHRMRDWLATQPASILGTAAAPHGEPGFGSATVYHVADGSEVDPGSEPSDADMYEAALAVEARVIAEREANRAAEEALAAANGAAAADPAAAASSSTRAGFGPVRHPFRTPSTGARSDPYEREAEPAAGNGGSGSPPFALAAQKPPPSAP